MTLIERLGAEELKKPSQELYAPKQNTSKLANENFSAVIQRIADPSTKEIDRVIAELQSLREMVCNGGDRINREILHYARLNQSATQKLKVVADSLVEWKGRLHTPAS